MLKFDAVMRNMKIQFLAQWAQSCVLDNWCSDGLRPKPKAKMQLKTDESGQICFI